MQETQVQSLGWEKSHGEEIGNPFHYSCLENSMDRGAWWATDPRVINSQTLLSDSHTHIHTHIMENSYQYIQLLKTTSDINNALYHCKKWNSFLLIEQRCYV